MFPDDFETRGEPVPQFVAPWDAIRRRKTRIDEIQDSQKQERFVRTLVTIPADTNDSHIEVVESLYRIIYMHGMR